jgi:hypothetical protein
MYRRQRTQPKETEPNTMFNKIILIGRLGQNAEAKTAHVVLNIATQESWKNDKGDYETRTNGTASMPGEIFPSSERL